MTITVQYEGTLQGLATFLEAYFKDPNVLTLSVTATLGAHAQPPALAQGLESRIAQSLEKLSGLHHLWRQRWLGFPPEYPGGIADVVALTRSKQKIQAIKALRALTECGLKEAKDIVEQVIERSLASETPGEWSV